MAENADSICVYDFAGNYKDCGRWADYYPAEKVVRFGGYWCPVPDMPAEAEPTESTVCAHADKYESECAARLAAWLAEVD